jgi:hypothetical protein
MKKIIALLTLFFVASILIFTGCKKPTGTFNLNNSVEYSMSVEWCSYNMSVGAFGFNSYTVASGSGTAKVWANGYGYWGSIYFTVPTGGSNTLYTYWTKSDNGDMKKGQGMVLPTDAIKK